METPTGHPPRFLDLINEVYEEEEKERLAKPLREVRHNPSSASVKKPDGKVIGACLRQLFYKATGVAESEPKQLTTYLQMDFGNAIHEKLQSKLLKSKRIKFASEVAGKVKQEGLTQDVSFRLDGLVDYHGEQGCLEIKTVQSFALTRMIKEIKGPKEADILQVLSYFGTNPDLHWAVIVYFGRDTAYRSEHKIVKQADGSFTVQNVVPNGAEKPLAEYLKYEKIVERWKELETYLEKNEVPSRDFKVVLSKEGTVAPERTKNHVVYKSDRKCLNCNYKTLCWVGEGKEKDSYKIIGE